MTAVGQENRRSKFRLTIDNNPAINDIDCVTPDLISLPRHEAGRGHPEPAWITPKIHFLPGLGRKVNRLHTY